MVSLLTEASIEEMDNFFLGGGGLIIFKDMKWILSEFHFLSKFHLLSDFWSCKMPKALSTEKITKWASVYQWVLICLSLSN